MIMKVRKHDETETDDDQDYVVPVQDDEHVVTKVLFVAGTSMESGFGLTSPEPNPSWKTVALQLSRRLPNFCEDAVLETITVTVEELTTDAGSRLRMENFHVVICLGIATMCEEEKLLAVIQETLCNSATKVQAFLADQTCTPTIQNAQFAGDYYRDLAVLYPHNNATPLAKLQQIVQEKFLPWSSVASGQRLLQKTHVLLSRKSTEDYLFCLLFVIHALVQPLAVVASDINPSWEKGLQRNFQEFFNMATKCGPVVLAAVTDPATKRAIDLLQACDLRDQVGSYRVIVSNETPALEEFTLCVLQRGDCFDCDAPILQQPRVPLLETWRGRPLDAKAAQTILMGHLDWNRIRNNQQKEELEAFESDSDCGNEDWSWKIVVGANPAYDAFPMQHQLFYPSGGPGKEKKRGGALWYDPVFCVETLQGELVWCKRHYRCLPRKHWSGRTAGAWTLTTLDNGMVSEEHWTTVDAADDLSWVVLHYSGAAKRAGQSYVGALLCTRDGKWPASANLERIRAAFAKCDLELWELFGGSTEQSYMWSEAFLKWRNKNPPMLDPIGDKSITTWRKQEREAARLQGSKEVG